MQTALLLLLERDHGRVERVSGIYRRDWRDVLVWAGLGQPDWPHVLDDELGPA